MRPIDDEISLSNLNKGTVYAFAYAETTRQPAIHIKEEGRITMNGKR